MGNLKFAFKQLFYRGKIVSKFLYEQLEDLQAQIDELSSGEGESSAATVTVKENVELTAPALGSNFGAAANFTGVGVVKNTEGVYLVVSDGTAFKYITMEDLT